MRLQLVIMLVLCILGDIYLYKKIQAAGMSSNRQALTCIKSTRYFTAPTLPQLPNIKK